MFKEYITFNNQEWYLIDWIEHEIALYESCKYGEDTPQLLVNTNEVIGYAHNGLEDYYNKEYIKL